MDLRKLALAAAAGTTLLAAAPAFADHRDHRDHWRASSHSWRAPHNRHHHHYYPGYYRARTYYMPPPRVYYTSPPAYYYEPAPVIYGRIPLGHHSSIGFSLPLN